MSTLREWAASSRAKHEAGTLGAGDFEDLDAILQGRQSLLVLTCKTTNLRSAVFGWSRFDPNDDAVHLPEDEPPYASVMDAIRDGWRVVQFPMVQAVNFHAFGAEYVGFDFYLERYI